MGVRLMPPSADHRPSYLKLLESGELERRVEQARALLSPCRVCPRKCGVLRDRDVMGFCRTGTQARLAHAGSHFGEEPPLSGRKGAGTVFFAGCNLACRFCQNHQISQSCAGEEVNADALANVYLDLQRQGCHNIDLVSPSHVLPQALEAVLIAARRGLRLPIVYNSGGYDSLRALKLLEDVVDMYLPDAKYANDAVARRLSGADGYVAANRAALREMFRQVGLLETDVNGLAVRGLIVRHLVLPNGLSGTVEVFRFLAAELDPAVFVSLMAQYSPQHMAFEEDEINRPLTRTEYEEALAAFDDVGLENAFVQQMDAQETGLPDFQCERPFEW
jgi:putative pyruvate formate lyase activating enzyme